MLHRLSPVRRVVCAAAIVASPLIASEAAFAADPNLALGRVSVSAKVNVDDLDLRSDSDVARLHRRIGYAAKSVCGFADPRQLSMVAEVRRCQQEALNAASGHADAIVAAVRAGKDRLAVRESLRVVAR